jgi:hypothetical protein
VHLVGPAAPGGAVPHGPGRALFTSGRPQPDGIVRLAQSLGLAIG